ncbi:hypothetical protein ACO2Q0_10980 [Phenylobacterium sp. VNQ135]
MRSFRKTTRRPIRRVSRKDRPLNQRLYRDVRLPDLSGLILYGQL